MITGFVGLLSSILLTILGVPIGFALSIVAFVGLIYIGSFDVAVVITRGVILTYMSTYTWTVIPMFILMGQIGYHSGLLKDIFGVARKWFGHLPGGLAISVEIASAVFAAASGSSQAACIVIGQSAIPAMQESGYSDRMSTGVVAAGGSIAALIPPSLTIVIYGLLVDESIAKLLIAGFIPGIVTALIYIVFIYLRCLRMPTIRTKYSWKERFFSIRYLWIVVVLIIAIMGGIYTGWTTPTEAGAAGAFVLFLIAILLGKIRIGSGVLWRSIMDTVKSCGMILILLVAAILLSRFLVLSGFNREFSNIILALDASKFTIFIIVTLVYLFLGCFIGGSGMLVLTLPVIHPLMMELGFSGIWFGIICVKYVEMAVITPPMGVNIYAVKSITKVPLEEIIKGALPFLSMDLLTILIFYLFPEIITFLPSMIG